MCKLGSWKHTRIRRLAEAQNWRCCYCGKLCRLYYNRRKPELMITWDDQATIEHVIPDSVYHGSKYDWLNQVMACGKCNNDRGDYIPWSLWKFLINEFGRNFVGDSIHFSMDNRNKFKMEMCNGIY